MSLTESKLTTYKYFPPTSERYKAGIPILSIMITCYYNVEYIEKAVESVLGQSYSNVELILIDNGAHADVKKYLHSQHASQANTSLIVFERNQFDFSDINKQVAVCWNAGVIEASGDYVCHLIYDDLFSKCYASRMIKLFMENPKCATAAPLPCYINEDGDIPDLLNVFIENNTRNRYTDGFSVAFDFIKNNPLKLYSAPGEILVIKRSLLLKYGGYDRLVDTTQVLKYMILGDTGFDPEAKIFWRSHANQLSKISKNYGNIYYKYRVKAWRLSGIVDLWETLYDKAKVELLISYINRSNRNLVIYIIKGHLRDKQWRRLYITLINLIIECPLLFPLAIYNLLIELSKMVKEKLKSYFINNLIKLI